MYKFYTYSTSISYIKIHQNILSNMYNNVHIFPGNYNENYVQIHKYWVHNMHSSLDTVPFPGIHFRLI